MAAKTIFDKVDKLVEETQKKVIDSASTPEAKVGLRQHFTQGYIVGAEPASAVILNSVASSIDSPLVPGDLYGGADQIIRNGFHSKIQLQANPLGGLKITDATQGGAATSTKLFDAMTKLKLDHKELMEQALKDPNIGAAAKKALTDSLKVYTLHSVIKDLASDKADGTPGIAAFKSVFANGDFTQEYKVKQGDSTSLNYPKLLSDLAAKDPEALKILQSQLNDSQTRAAIAAYDTKVHNSPEHAAYRARFLNNSYNSIFTGLVEDTQKAQQKAVTEALQRVQATEAAITAAGGQNATTGQRGSLPASSSQAGAIPPSGAPVVDPAQAANPQAVQQFKYPAPYPYKPTPGFNPIPQGDFLRRFLGGGQ
jgi:hypothetical protein